MCAGERQSAAGGATYSADNELLHLTAAAAAAARATAAAAAAAPPFMIMSDRGTARSWTAETRRCFRRR